MYNQNQYMNNYNDQYMMNGEDDRFFFAPFLIGGLAGTALGYGIANNNQINNGSYYQPYPVYPVYPVYPNYPIENNYFY